MINGILAKDGSWQGWRITLDHTNPLLLAETRDILGTYALHN
jgi:hypothetical protein